MEFQQIENNLKEILNNNSKKQTFNFLECIKSFNSMGFIISREYLYFLMNNKTQTQKINKISYLIKESGLKLNITYKPLKEICYKKVVVIIPKHEHKSFKINKKDFYDNGVYYNEIIEEKPQTCLREYKSYSLKTIHVLSI